MSEVANLKITQQRIVSAFMRQHFGNSIVESQRKREATSSSDHVPCSKHMLTTNDKREVIMWCRNLNAMTMHNIKKLNKKIYLMQNM